MNSNSSRRRRAGKAPKKPGKPRKDFPLYPHAGGRWAKKVRGDTVYFTKWVDDPKGIAALEQWLEEKDDLLAGRKPRSKSDELTVADLCNEFLTHHEERRDRGEISARTFQGLHSTCAGIVNTFGRKHIVVELDPNDFGKLRSKLAETRKAVALRNEMQRVRSVFRYAYVNRLIGQEVHYGSKFGKPELKQVRRERRQTRDAYGKRMFEAHEIRRILAEAKPPLHTMVLLAINCGFGQTDLARLPIEYVDLDSGMIDYPRPKTEADRLCPLWPETIAAIREWLPRRPKAKDKADAGLMFLTVRGSRWVKVSEKTGAPKDAIGQEFGKVLRKLGLKRPRLSFYGLRHSFRTIADETIDHVATNLIMGHVDGTMGAVYREDVAEHRLRRVAEHVREWLFAEEDDGPEKNPRISDPTDPCDPAGLQEGETGSHGPQGSQSAQDFFEGRPRLRIVG